MNKRIFLLLVAAGLALVMSSRSFAEQSAAESCEAYKSTRLPPFRVARHERLIGGLQLNVYVADHDTNRMNLLAIACKLEKRNRNSHLLAVYFLDEERSARLFTGPGSIEVTWSAVAVRGDYYVDREKNVQEFGWWPDRKDRSHYEKVGLSPPPPI